MRLEKEISSKYKNVIFRSDNKGLFKELNSDYVQF